MDDFTRNVFLYFAANLLKYHTNSNHYFALECQTFGDYLTSFVMVDLILPIFYFKAIRIFTAIFVNFSVAGPFPEPGET